MITEKEAIQFLKNHQPMPSDDVLTEEEINEYDEVRKYYVNNPNEICIPLFLNSFGGKDGLGVYQMVEDIFMMYTSEKVIPHIIQALNSPYDSIKYWAIQIASNFPDMRLFNNVEKCLKSEDSDIRLETISTLGIYALNNINRNKAIKILRDLLAIEKDDDIIDFCNEVIEDIYNDG